MTLPLWVVIIITMPSDAGTLTLTTLLRESLAASHSLRAVARETGLDHASLIRFVRGEQSIRLDLADRLAAHFGIVSTKKKEGK